MKVASQSKVPNAQNTLAQKTSQINISDVIKKIGGYGLYQQISFVLLLIASCICGQLASITPYLYYQEQYQCQDIPSRFSSCVEYVCSLPPQRRIEYLSGPTIDTLPTKFGFHRCTDSANILNNSILIMLVGYIVAYVFMAILADFFTKKRLILFGAFASIAGIICSLIVKNIFTASCSLAVGSFGLQIVFIIGFNVISQIMDEQHRDTCLVIFQCSYSFGQLVNIISYFFIKDWQIIFKFFFIVPLLFFIVAYLILSVDTPISLIKNLSPTQALQKLLWIAKVNKIEQANITVDEITRLKQLEQTRRNDKKRAKKFTLIDLFQYPSLRGKTIGLMIVQASIAILYFAPNLMLDDFQFSIFFNRLVYGLMTLISTVSCYCFIQKFKRKYYAFGCFIITLVWSLVLVFVYRLKSEGEEISILTMTANFLAILAITFAMTTQYTLFLVYISELYPTQVRVQGISLVNMISTVILSVFSFMIESAINSGSKIMILFCIFAGIGLFFSFCLPETFQQKQRDYIEQIEAQMDSQTIGSAKELPQSERGLQINAGQDR